jgi:hypothetical protein
MSAKLESEIETDIKQQLLPLLNDSSALTTCLQLMTSSRVKRALNTLRQTQPMIIELGKNSTGRQKSFFDAIMYMFSVEASTNLIADLLIMMLAAKGNPSLLNSKKYKSILSATSIEDLNLDKPYISLGDKINFLNASGLSYLKKYVNKDLRNYIAHMDFEIDHMGDFFVYQTIKNNSVQKMKLNVKEDFRILAIINSTSMHQIKLAIDKTKK